MTRHTPSLQKSRTPCRLRINAVAERSPIRGARGCRIGREPSVSTTVERLLLASDNSQARAPGTILAMP